MATQTLADAQKARRKRRILFFIDESRLSERRPESRHGTPMGCPPVLRVLAYNMKRVMRILNAETLIATMRRKAKRSYEGCLPFKQKR